MRRYLLTATSAFLAIALVSGCGVADPSATTADTTAETANLSVSAGTTAVEAMAANAASHDVAADHSWDESEVQEIALTGSGATSGADGVSIDGSTVTITKAGTYRLSGTLGDGQVVVNTTDTGIVRLILDDAHISSSTTAAIAFMDAKLAMVVLADGTSNTLSDASTYVYADGADEPDAALFSTADLTIMGEGELTVQGNAYDAIASKDGLVISSGAITVDAVDDGIRGKDYLIVDGGTQTITAGGDGLKSTNVDDETMGYIAIYGGTTSVTAQGDGFDAETDVIVFDGDITVSSGGGTTGTVVDETTSTKGVKGSASVIIDAGTLEVNALDDSLHSNGIVTVGGGDLSLATGDDGIHADVALTITGGTVAVTESVEGLEAADIVITGGDTTVSASDDGINAAGGTSDTVTDAQQVDPAAGGEPPAGEIPAGGGGGPMGAEGAAGDYSLTITGGTLIVDADGDGLDSNGVMTMSGGTVVVLGPTNSGNGAIDVEGTFEITGGTLIASGASGMAMAPATTSSQGWISANFSSTQKAGTVIHVVDAAGTGIASFTSTKDLQSVIYSGAGITSGETYTISTGGSVAGTTIGGLSTTPDIAGASSAATVVAGEAAAGGMGPGGRR